MSKGHDLESLFCLLVANLFTYLAGMISDSNSVIKCRLTIFFDGGIPRAVDIVSAENDVSNTTSPPCTPLSENLNGF